MSRMSSLTRHAAAAVAFAALVAVPAAAAPPPRPAPKQTLTVRAAAQPATIGGKRYSLRVAASRTIGAGSVALTLTFSRGLGSASQVHEYRFALPRRALACRPGLALCRLASGGSLGRFGRLELAFSATGRSRPASPGAGCTGTAMQRSGTIAGVLRFGDRSASLRASGHPTRVRATAQRASSACSAAQPTCHTRIFGLGGADPASAFAVVARTSGAAEAEFTFAPPLKATSPAEIERTIAVRNLPTRSLTIAPDLSSASFDAQGLPFLSGTVSYSAGRSVAPFSSSCGQGTATLGGVTGDIAAIFDGVGERPLTATGGHVEKIP